jgi:hypothetical protein
MYNLLHWRLLGGYEGEVTVENFREWAKEAEDAERNFETMLLSLSTRPTTQRRVRPDQP